MILSLHNLAKTYKVLPSEALTRGTTFDLYVLDTHHKYIKYQEAKEQGQVVPKKTGHTQEELQAMIDRVRRAKNENKES